MAKKEKRISDEQPLGDIIIELLSKYRLGEKLDEHTLKGKWSEIAGPLVAKHTKSITLKKKILYIELDSSVVRKELSMIRSEIIEQLNSYFHKNSIEGIVLK